MTQASIHDEDPQTLTGVAGGTEVAQQEPTRDADGWRRVDAWLHDRNVRVVHVLHSDLFGRARSKQFPAAGVEGLADGVAYSKTSLVESLDGEMLEGAGFPADLGHPDLHALADPESARVVPWQPDSAWILSDLFEDGEPSALCSRGTLRKVCARFSSLGLAPVVAAEPEFYLLHDDADGVRPCGGRRRTSYATGGSSDGDGVLDVLHRALIDLRVEVGAASTEYSPGQFEINLQHGDALAAADHAFLLKEATKVLAEREGLLATFMPKPLHGSEGSSMHLHVSLWHDGANAFAAAGDELSRLGLSFLAGVLEHAPALTAFASPTVNSYKRLRPGGLVATQATWAHDSRGAYVRVPKERGDATRIELRGGDASANVYLLIAAALAAGLDGIERDLMPYEAGAVGRPIPASLEEALAALEGDAALVDGLGDELVRTHVALKRLEISRYAEHVTDWEWRHYAYRA